MHTAPEYIRSEVPAGVSGAWVIEKVTIPDREYDSATDPRPDCFKFRPGIYTSLRRDSTQLMTDLYDEWWTQRAGIVAALARGGEVLITGLGLGLVAESMLRPVQSRVERITIVEYSSDVIRLVRNQWAVDSGQHNMNPPVRVESPELAVLFLRPTCGAESVPPA